MIKFLNVLRQVILKPFHMIGSHRMTEPIVHFFSKNKWALYVLTSLITAIILYFLWM